MTDLAVLIRQLQGRLAGIGGFTVGADSLTGTGTDQATATISHGLNTTPIAVFVQASDDGKMNAIADSYTDTTFRAVLTTTDGSTFATDRTFVWLAVA